jgi:hypothetical protein
MTTEQPAPAPQQQAQPAKSVSLPVPLQSGEQVLELYRRHWWFLWPYTLWLIIVTFVPVGIAAWLLDAIGILDDLGIFWTVPAVLWIGYWGIRAIFNWYRYRNDIWIVTNQRIVDAFRSNPFNKRIATADLVNLQDINVQKRGLTSTMLNYGDVVCKTASASTEGFTIGGVPNPEDVQLLIDRERDRERSRVHG